MARLADLVAIVDRLRGPGGCPWDRAQSPRSMRPYLLEECYELLDAIESSKGEKIEEELGDMLFVVLLLARMGADTPAREGGGFDIESVAGRIASKMMVRHPHVFGSPEERSLESGGIAAWEARKQKETAGAPRSRLAGVPRSLPALLRTHRQCEKVATVGFDWPDAGGVLDKVKEELLELEEAIASGDPAAIEHEYGDALMALGSLGRHVGALPEESLRLANDRFAARFAAMERLARSRGLDLASLDADGLDALWEEAKAAPSPSPGGE